MMIETKILFLLFKVDIMGMRDLRLSPWPGAMHSRTVATIIICIRGISITQPTPRLTCIHVTYLGDLGRQ